MKSSTAKLLVALGLFFSGSIALGVGDRSFDRERDPSHARQPSTERGFITQGQKCYIVGDMGSLTSNSTQQQYFLEEFLENQTNVTCWTPPARDEPIAAPGRDQTLEERQRWLDRKRSF